MKHFVIAVTNDGVSDRRMSRLAQLLRTADYQVTIVARVFAKTEAHPGIVTIICSRRKGPAAYWEYNRKLAKVLFQLRPDILCLVDSDTLPALFFSKMHRSVPVLVDCHEFF